MSTSSSSSSSSDTIQVTPIYSNTVYRVNEYFQQKPASMRAAYSRWTCPYTTAEPEITKHELDKNDEFMVLSTDGLFQDLNSQQVVDYVGQYLNACRSGSNYTSNFDARNASTFLIKKALLHASEFAVGR